MLSKARGLFVTLSVATAIGVLVAACGGTSDADKTATAAPGVTAAAEATAQAQAEATATAVAQSTAAALRSLAAQSETVQYYVAAYQGLSAAIKERLDAAGIDEARFATALGTFGPDTDPEADAIAEVFGAIGDLEVTFLPSQALASLTGPGLLRVAIGIEDETAAAIRSGDAFLTGAQLAQIFSVIGGFIESGDGQDEDVTDIDTEEVVAFFASLPDDVKGELEAAGWTEERIAAFIGEAEDGVEEIPPIDELRSLLLPLSDIPVPPFQANVQALLGLLDALPSIATAPLIQQIGQDAVDELKAGARPPTGGEFLALIEFALRLSG